MAYTYWFSSSFLDSLLLGYAILVSKLNIQYPHYHNYRVDQFLVSFLLLCYLDASQRTLGPQRFYKQKLLPRLLFILTPSFSQSAMTPYVHKTPIFLADISNICLLFCSVSRSWYAKQFEFLLLYSLVTLTNNWWYGCNIRATEYTSCIRPVVHLVQWPVSSCGPSDIPVKPTNSTCWQIPSPSDCSWTLWSQLACMLNSKE